MSSTNKTNYYDLSQYVGTDKPTYLGDYNSDMSKIDSAIHGVQETATTANQTAGSAEAKVNTALSDMTSLKARVGVVEGNVSNLQDKEATQDTAIQEAKKSANDATTTANNALSVANSANVNIANAKMKPFNALTNTHSHITVSKGTMTYNDVLKIVALEINFSTVSAVFQGEILCRIPSNITPPKQTISLGFCATMCTNYDNVQAYDSLVMQEITIDTNGYLHCNMVPNSTLAVSGLFAVPEW